MSEEKELPKRQLILVGIAVLLTGILLIVKPSHSVFQVNKTINIMDAKVGDFGSKVLFVKNFGGKGDETFSDVSSTADGGYVAVGWSGSIDGDLTGLNKGADDGVIVKYDSSGDLLWKKNFGGGTGDRFYDVITTIDDCYVVVGYSRSSDGDLIGLNKGGQDAIIVKYDSSGTVVWKKTFGGTSDDEFMGIATTTDGGYIVVGDSSSTDGDLAGLNSGPRDAIIVKYDSSGTVLWNKNFGGSGQFYFQSVSQTSDGGYIAVGQSNSTFSMLIIKCDSSGNYIWEIGYDATYPNDSYDIVATSDGKYIVVGSNKSSHKAAILKIDNSGNVFWSSDFGGSGAESFYDVATTSDGGCIAVGRSNSSDGDLTGLNKGYEDAIIVKYDVSGNLVWKKTFGGNYTDQFNGVVTTSDGSYVAVGVSTSTDGDLAGLNKGQSDAIIFKGK